MEFDKKCLLLMPGVKTGVLIPVKGKNVWIATKMDKITGQKMIEVFDGNETNRLLKIHSDDVKILIDDMKMIIVY